MSNLYKESDIRKLPIMVSLLLGGFVSLLSETLLNVALPKFMAEFNISANAASWLVTGYLLVIGICVPIAAFLMRRFRTRILFSASMVFFILGTVICLTAPIFSVILIGRFIQAIGTAILMPLMLNTVLILNPPEKRGFANGIVILVIMLAPAVGPTLSGFLLMYFNWRSLFVFTLPISITAFAIGFIYMRDITRITRPKFDVISALFSTLGFGLYIYGLSCLSHINWVCISAIGLGVVFLIAFVIRQLTMENPMLDLRVFKIPQFSLGILFTSMAMVALFSNLMMMPIFLQRVTMLTTVATGLIMMPSGFINGLLAPITGKVYDKFGSKYLLPGGLLLIVTTLWVMSFFNESVTTGRVILLLSLLSIGVPFVMTSAQTDALNALPQEYYPHGVAILNTIQQISAAIGSSFFITVMTMGQGFYLSNNIKTGDDLNILSLTYGINLSYKVGGGIVFIAFLISLVYLVLRHLGKIKTSK